MLEYTKYLVVYSMYPHISSNRGAEMRTLMIITCIIVLPVIVLAQETWINTYSPCYWGDPSNYSASNLRIAQDGGYVVNGSNTINDEPYQSYQAGYIFKVDNFGNFLWSKSLGTFGGEAAYSSTCFIENDSAELIVSSVQTVFAVDLNYIRISATGDIEEIIPTGDFIPQSMVKNGNIYVGGCLMPYPALHYPAIQVLNQDGTIIDTQHILFDNIQYEGKVYSILTLNDNSLICVGYIEIPPSNEIKAFITRIDTNGNEIWSNLLIDHSSIGYSVEKNNQSILLTGSCSNDDLHGFLWLMDYDGNTNWLIYKEDWQHSAKMMNQDNFLVSGPNLYCIDESGNTIWESDFYPNGNEKNIDIDNNEFLVFSGSTNSFVTITKTDLFGQVSANNNLILEGKKDQINNSPNPFNPSTTISFSIQNDSEVELSIYNIKGQKVKTLANNHYGEGIHSIIWDGDDQNGHPVSSGLYCYKLNINGNTAAVKKCLLLK